MRIKNLPSIESMNGSQDALVIEQTDGSEDKSRKVSPAQIKQYVLGNSIDDIYSVMGQNGAKNLIPYPYASNSFSQRDIDFTCLSDGTINANGTNDGTGNSTYNFVSYTLSKGSYVINGCPIQTGNNYRCGVIRASDDVTLASDYGSGANFTLDTDTRVRVFVQVYRGKTANNIIFKPMIRLAADTDDSYQPYAKTNKQLTEAIGDLSQTGLTGDSVAEQLGSAKTYVDNAVSGLIKVAHITGTTSANGNMQLTGLSKANAIVLGCQFLGANNACVVAIPYIYSALNTGNWGVHCLMESGPYAIAANMDLQGYVYYIDKRAYTS